MDFGHKHTWNQLTHIYHTFTHDIKSFNTSLDAHPVPEDITSSDDNKHSVRQLIQSLDTRSEQKKTLNGNKAKTTTKKRYNKQKIISDESDDNSNHKWEQTLSDEEMDDKNVKKKRKYVKKSEKSGENSTTTPLKRKYKEKTILFANGKCFRPKNFICDYIGCEKQFAENEKLLAHIRVRHTMERPFGCDVCHKTYPTERCLRAHQKMHSEGFKRFPRTPKKKYNYIREKAFVCHYSGCDKRFREREYLLAHIRITHTKERPFGCDVCHKTFPTQSRLKTHQRLHTDTAKPFVCSWVGCDSAFRTNQQLSNHMQSHEQLRQYACDECDSRFNQKRSLQAHKNTVHSTARPYTCDWPACEATYKDLNMLKRHKETHLGQHKRQHTLPFVCSWPACDRRFPSNNRLQDHMNAHQGLRVVECPVEGCDKTFTSKPCARQHLRQVHKYKTTEGLIPISN
ncbi:unnamed protein product [Medioppia subpectinata]|uniref:C2H2-type domain-containing protein n=1 Tax=Medioppia subpectinata TaxID=1979941 RepID=A0A7R9Q339_9ACAR|nr:unnamed protein product [Medioppia subpectinata]CAG2110913.1 unnamed protein product [Medioppia subpectinata]